MRSILGMTLAIIFVTLAATALAVEPPLWLRYPAISPDGQTIVFSYRGDLYRVPSSGGPATPLTVHAAHDTGAVWSPDGSTIAFASDRYGNYDIYVMPAEGGEATRLTFHSANDLPTSFTPDGEAVVFSSTRLDARTCVQFPTGAQPELYRVGLAGGMPVQIVTTPAEHAAYDSTSRRLVYTDRKGYESSWRKHDNSSFARDVWLYDIESEQHTRLTAFGADDRQPVWGPGETSLFYLSERSGTFNVWKLGLDDPSAPEQITEHQTHPVRFLSASRNGDLCYTWDGEIYVRTAGSPESRKLDVTVATDRRDNEMRWVDVARDITEFELSPNGKEIAFIARGEVFVTSAGHGTTRRITNTAEQERSLSFSPDSRSLLYASERDGSWNVYRSDLTDDDEPSFFNATAIQEKQILETAAETFQPRFSPDGKEVAYLEERTTLKVINLESGESRTILPAELNYSYADGDQWYDWSADGKSFLVQFLSPTRWSSEVGLVPASGEGEVVNLTKSGYEDVLPHWVMKGEAMIWITDRHGMRRQALWGSQDDVYIAFFTRDAWDRFRLDEAEFEQVKEKEEEAKEKDKKKEEEAEEEAEEEEEEPKLADPVDIDLDGLQDRMVRLTIHSARLSGAALTPDGETLLYLARFEKGYDLWSYTHRKKEVKLLTKLNAERAGGLMVASDGEKAYLLADRQIKEVEIESGDDKPVALEARMELNAAAERAYLFEHAWRQTQKKFYVEDLHDVNWDLYKEAYARFLPHVDNNWDFAELVSELQGELNASHLGCAYRARNEEADATATLAFFPDPEHQGDGIKIAEIIEGSPLDRADTKVEAGVVIESIDGDAIPAGSNWYPLLNHKAGTLVRLALFDPDSDERWEERVKPITRREESGLLYKRWTRSRRAEVERLSDGRLGYTHLRGMNDGSYREMFEETFGRDVDKEGIVIDTRFNGGGNLVEALTIFLTGKVYTRIVPRGRELGVEPYMRWTKPSIVVMNEGNYSDAHCFPAAFTALDIGETVGMPVPGTCTSVWWEPLQDRTLVFGIPQVGYIDGEGDMLENKHLAPDHMVDNDPTLEAGGRDQQLEKAVEVLLDKISR
jgi:Tol biopolymer transport system component/C-terminal processing protease CtpA/Prc